MSLDDALAKINKMFGPEMVMRLGDVSERQMDVIPTGSIALDTALGVGGLPRGRMVEIYGPESSGKSTLALHIIANAQRMGGNVAYIDTEHSFDPGYGSAIGVNVDSMLIAQPETAEQVIEIAKALIESGDIAVLVVDSVAAMVPRAELEGDAGDSHVGIMARLMSQSMRRLTGIVAENNVLVVWINQLRQKIGVTWGSGEVTTGGNALKFYASVRLDVRRIETEKTGTEASGIRARVKVAKNKCAPPLKVAEYSVEYGEGISRSAELVDLGVKYQIITKGGSWFKYGTQQWQGRAATMEAFKADAALADEVEALIRKAIAGE